MKQQTYSFEKSKRYLDAKKAALKIMSGKYDPFHDEGHALSVERNAKRIYVLLADKPNTNLELVCLACFFHDTSRVKIKTNLLRVLLQDESISSKIAYGEMIRSGYKKKTRAKYRE